MFGIVLSAVTRLVRRKMQAASGYRLYGVVGVMALLTMTNPIEARSIIPIQGGGGDAGFEDRCPANQFLIGFGGRTGIFIDQLQIICAPILPSGKHGTSYYGPLHGGPGGAASELGCNSDAFVSGVNFAYYTKHPTIIGVQLVCRSTQGSDQSTVDFGAQGVNFSGDDIYAQQHCSSEELASGLAGRYGKNVNALGLFCDAPSSGSSPSAPGQDARPIKTTGTGAMLLCPQGYVWREASPNDHVCVTPADRTLTRQENAEGATHVSQTDQTYGPNTCVQGYVWRAAYPGDAVCVTPVQRDAAAAQNAAAPVQIPK